MIWILRAIEKAVYGKAARVVAIMSSISRWLVRLGVEPEKVACIENWIDVRFFASGSNEQAAEFRKRLGIVPHDVLVLYSGNMGRSHPAEVLVQSARRLADRDSLHFVLIGFGPGRASAKEIAKQAGLRRVHFLPLQPRDDLPSVLAAADVAVGTLRQGMDAFSLPSRVYMFMAVMLPIIVSADKESGVAELIRRAQGGICVEPESADSLAAAIAALANDAEQRERLGRSGRDYAA